MAEADDYCWDSEEWIELCVLNTVSLGKSGLAPPSPPLSKLQAAGVGLDHTDGLKHKPFVNEDESFQNQLPPIGSTISFLEPGWNVENVNHQALVEFPSFATDPSKVKEWLTSYIAEHSLCATVVKSNSSYVLVSFNDMLAKQNFFDQLLKDDRTGLPCQINSVTNSSSTKRVYPIFVQLSCSQSKITSDFQSLIRLFGGNMFLQLTPSNRIERSPANGLIPRIFVIMILDLKLPATAKRREKFSNSSKTRSGTPRLNITVPTQSSLNPFPGMKAIFVQKNMNGKGSISDFIYYDDKQKIGSPEVQLDGNSSWKKLERSNHELNSTQLYVHDHNPLVAVGFLLGSGTGIRIQLNASSKDSFSQCCRYYSSLLNLDSQPIDSDGASHVTLSPRKLDGTADRYLEFRINYNPSYQVNAANEDIALNLIRSEQIPEKFPSEKISPALWTSHDPDKNRVAYNVPVTY